MDKLDLIAIDIQEKRIVLTVYCTIMLEIQTTKERGAVGCTSDS